MKTLLWSCCFFAVVAIARAAVQPDIEYAHVGGESLRLDASVPQGPGPFPAAILVHGGGWMNGDKSGGPGKGFMVPMHEPLERGGFAWFSINYRLAPKHPYPACVDDVLTAIRWVKSHAAEYRVDPSRIALSGESAGGHLVALAAVRADAGTRVAAVIPFYGLFDLTGDLKPGAELPTHFARLFGRTNLDERAQILMREASPMQRVKEGLPPFLLVHGTADAAVPFQQSVLLQAKLREHAVPCDLLTIKDGVHGMISWDVVAPDYKQQVVTWIAKVLNAGPVNLVKP